MSLLLGIDDAGRGPVIGPMVLAGCMIESEIQSEFRQIGVRDSKILTQKRREFLEGIIKEKALAFKVEVISPEEIDTKSAEGVNLNDQEAIATAKIINTLNIPSNTDGAKIKVIVDCPSVSIKKWSDFLKMHITNLSNLDISCEHKADRNHAVVSAASILAKCEREKQMAKIKKEYGDEIGSGYTSDPTTQKFIAKNATSTKHRKIFRKTWSTWQKASGDSKQKKLA